MIVLRQPLSFLWLGDKFTVDDQNDGLMVL